MRVALWILAVLVVLGMAALFLRGLFPRSGKTESGRSEASVRARPDGALTSGELAEATLRGAGASAEHAPLKGSVVLTGLVLDAATGRPIADAQVRCGPVAVRTDPRGSFTLRSIGSATRLVVRAEDYVETGVDSHRNARTPMGRVAPIRLHPRQGTLPGRVRNWQGHPVAGVTIAILPARTEYVSAEDGSFGPVAVAQNVPVLWEATAPDRPAFDGEWEPGSEGWGRELAVDLPPITMIEGVVVDADDRPLAGAQVCDLDRPGSWAAETDADGKFHWPAEVGRIARLGAALGESRGWRSVMAGVPTRITARPAGSWPIEPSAARSRTSSASAALHAVGPLSGRTIRVVDQDGRAVPGASVRAVRADVAWSTHEFTDAEGRCRLEVPSGWLRITASHFMATRPTRVQVELPREPLPNSIVLRLRRPADASPRPSPAEPHGVRGLVTDGSGRPITNAVVDLVGGHLVVHTDLRGEFVIPEGTSGETAILRVVVSGYVPVLQSIVVGERSVRVRMPRRGVVFFRLGPRRTQDENEEDDSEDASSSEFIVWEAGDFTLEHACFRSADAPYLAIDRPDSTLLDLPEGDYRIAYRKAPGAWRLYSEVDVIHGQLVRLEYDFPKVGRLHATVRTEDGMALDGATIRVARTGGYLGRTGPDGRWVADPDVELDPSLPAGRQELLVIRSGFTPALTEPIDLGQDATIRVVMHRGGTVRGVLVDAQGDPVRGTVSWLPAVGAMHFMTSADADGTFVLRSGLPPGNQRLVVQAVGRSPSIMTVEVRPPPEETRLRLEIE